MPRTGMINNFAFDPEVFGDYMQEQSCVTSAILTSGILMEDEILKELVGGSGNVGTVPFFLPVDNESDALNDDGKTNNVPTELKGSKQTFMAIARMKAWKEKTYTRYLTGKSPLTNLANNLVVPYYKIQWQKDLIAIIDGILGIANMAEHNTNLAVTTGTITDANKIRLTSHIDAGQKALGEKSDNFSLFICHSMIHASLVKQEMLEVRKYTDPNTMETYEFHTLGNMIVLKTDTDTVDATVAGFPVYKSYMVGRGAILTTDKTVHNPYGVDYDNETDGGVDKLYTKQAKVLHPNGFSIKADGIAEESPTRVELANPANWELRFNHLNVPIAMIKSNG